MSAKKAANSCLFMISSDYSESGLHQTDPRLPNPHPRQDNRYPRWNRASHSRAIPEVLPVRPVRECWGRHPSSLYPSPLPRPAGGYFPCRHLGPVRQPVQALFHGQRCRLQGPSAGSQLLHGGEHLSVVHHHKNSQGWPFTPLGARIAAWSRLSTFSASTFLSVKLRMDFLFAIASIFVVPPIFFS